MTAASVITVSSVTKKFGTFAAVDDVSFTVKAGEVVGFVGVNGAGKTTTINMLLGFTSPSRGSVELFGKKVKPTNAHRSHVHIGYAAGDMELPSRMTGRDYLDFVLSQSRGDHEERLAELVAIFGPQLDKKIQTLSRGNKQKIALVAAFVTEPLLVVLDEPTSGLDPIMQQAFLDLVRSEQQRGATVFMSSHYLQEVAEVCSRVLLMKNGRVVEDLSEKALEQAGGKAVRITARRPITKLPPHSSELAHAEEEELVRTTFTFEGDVPELLRWLAVQRGIEDVDISERTLEATFRSLYDDKERRG